MSSNRYIQQFANTLRLVRKHLGHTQVHFQFRIPKTHEFPIELHDINFGARVGWIRRMYKKNQLSKKQIDLLEKENMIWDVYELKFQCNLKALKRYKEIYGNLFVSERFIVPSTKEWPEEYWGWKLGHVAQRIRNSKEKLKKHRIEQLNGIDFIWNDAEGRFDKIYFPALQWYKQKFNHVMVPTTYCTPVDDGAIPKDIQGVRLGDFFCKAVRMDRELTDTQMKQLHDIGYDFLPNLKIRHNKLILQLQNYYKQHGSLAIPRMYRMDEYRLGILFHKLVKIKSYYKFYDAKVMQAMGLYRDITDTMFDQIVVSELDQYRKQKPNQIIYFNTALPNGTFHLGYLKYHCQHPKLVAYIAKYNL